MIKIRKQLTLGLLFTVGLSGLLYAFTINTSINNALQVIQRILITDSGTITGSVVLDLNTGSNKIFINPAFLANTTPYNSQYVLTMDSNGNLSITTGNVGPTGANGATGVSISGVNITTGNQLIITLSNGNSILTTGSISLSGALQNIFLSGNGIYISHVTSGNFVDLSNISVGPRQVSSGVYSVELTADSTNQASGDYSIVAGTHNVTRAALSSIGAGSGNLIETDATGGIIQGGVYNRLLNSSYYASIIGGINNTINAGPFSTIVGGSGNHIIGWGNNYILGGLANYIYGESNIVLGYNNQIDTSYGSYMIGSGNLITGGNNNVVIGITNRVNNSIGAIVAGVNNILSGSYAFLGGGLSNILYGDYNTLLGGRENYSTGIYNTTLGGFQNYISGARNVIAGSGNSITGDHSAIVAGVNNVISGNYATIIGGFNNSIQSNESYSIGTRNTLSAGSSIAIGFQLTVAGLNSIAMGNGGTVNGSNAFLRSDGSVATLAPNSNTFIIGASNGVGINTGTTNNVSLYVQGASVNSVKAYCDIAVASSPACSAGYIITSGVNVLDATNVNTIAIYGTSGATYTFTTILGGINGQKLLIYKANEYGLTTSGFKIDLLPDGSPDSILTQDAGAGSFGTMLEIFPGGLPNIAYNPPNTNSPAQRGAELIFTENGGVGYWYVTDAY